MTKYARLLVLLQLVTGFAYAQKGLSLQECYRLARQQNILLQQAQRSLQARQYNLDAEKRSYWPKLDLLAGYNYLSKPLEVNLQTVRNGIVEGSSQQSVNTANEVFREITGRDLSPAAQDRIKKAAGNIISGVYPDYNPALSRQSYFMAGLFLRQPLYLGGKLSAAQDLAKAQVVSGQYNQQIVEKEVTLAVGVQYLRVLYLNTILQHQQQIVAAYRKNRDYALSLKETEMLPPYLLNWSKVTLTQAETRHHNLELDKQNALVELNRLLDLPVDTLLTITDTLRYEPLQTVAAAPAFWDQNPAYRLLESKSDLAAVSTKAARSLSLPNIFAIGNLNLYQKDLPVTTPPWLVGVEMQWNLFNGFQTQKRTRAGRMLEEEARLAAEHTKGALQARMQVCINKMKALQQDVASLDTARQQARVSSTMLNERLKNQFSSVKDVNDALLLEEESEKVYYTAVLGYYLALAEYWSIAGTPEKLSETIN
jgi:outer membrane protein TolC